jgi:hypothetical protein
MELNMATPALLFPTISILVLAYTNRFVAIGNKIRDLYKIYKEEKSDSVLMQIKIFRQRIYLIRNLQIVGIACLLVSVLTMFLVYENLKQLAKYSFGVSLILLMIAFIMAGWEIIISTRALNIQLKDLEEKEYQSKQSE